MEVTKPSPFAEGIDPIIPEFNANPKKAGSGRKRAAKAEPTDAVDTSLKEESNLGEGDTKASEGEVKKAKIEPSEDVLVTNEGKKAMKTAASATSAATGAAAGRKKAKTKSFVALDDDDEIVIDDDSDDMDVSKSC